MLASCGGGGSALSSPPGIGVDNGVTPPAASNVPGASSAPGGSTTTTMLANTPQFSVFGIAATGNPIVGATVNAKCATGAGSTTTANDGSWSIPITGGAAPCVIEVSGATTSVVGAPRITLHGYSVAGGATNVTTLTEIILQNALATSTTTDFFADPSSTLAAPAVFQSALQAALSKTKTTYALTDDPLTVAFKTDHTGIDAILENRVKPILLKVTVAGAGGTVVSDPSGINCSYPDTCTAAFAPNTQVNLTTTSASAAIAFKNWSSATPDALGCNGSTSSVCGPLVLTADNSISANLITLQASPLNVSVAGAGVVTSTVGNPGAINCTSNVTGYSGGCRQNFYGSSKITLHASGTGFVGWAGPKLLPGGTTGCSGTADCTFVKTSGTQYITAIFASGGAAPTQLYTDVTSGPSTGGENNNGMYLSVFGKGFSASGAGTTTKMYLDNIEVSTYISLGTSRGRTDVQQLATQIGALGGMPNGTSLSIKVVTNGNIAADPSTLTFKINPGAIYFVSLNGDDTTGAPNDITHPYRNVQQTINNNSNDPAIGCTIKAGLQPVSTAGVWGLIVPGDVIVMRGGLWTNSHQTGDDFFLRVQNKSGTPATGAIQTGPITLMGYPSENVQISQVLTANTATAPGGGITSADSARQSIGCGAGMTITNLQIESGRNDGMISTQAGYNLNAFNGTNWRIVNNEMTGKSATYNQNAKGAGATGSGNGIVIVGNHVHDVYCGQKIFGDNGPLQNHGVYIDGTGSYEVAYNNIENIFGGNGIQTFSSSGTDITNVKIHHNLVHDVNKFGLNISAQSTTGFSIYNNVIYNTALSGLALQASSGSPLSGAKIYNNTIFNTVIGPFGLTSAGNHGVVLDNGSLISTSLDMRNNIFVASPGTAYVSGPLLGFGTFTNNLWFGGIGPYPDSSVTTSSLSLDPLFVSTTSTPPDLHLRASSPAVDAGSNAVSSTVINDFDAMSRPVGAGFDIGAYER